MRQATRVVTLFSCLLSALLIAPVAQAWEVPERWTELGTPQQWFDRDERFYRANRAGLFQEDRAQFDLDQAAQYAQATAYAHDLPPLTLADFRALPSQDQDRRRELADEQLDFVKAFGRRIDRYVQQTRENFLSGWGGNVGDVTVVGACLGRLGTAVGLDPTHLYAWNLLGFFAQSVGDLDRAETAFAAAQVLLDELPATALGDVRLRLARDRAWLARERGHLDEVRVHLQQAETLLGPDANDNVELTLLRGLLAAQAGDLEQAFVLAARLDAVPVRRFPINVRSSQITAELTDVTSWKRVPSDYLQAWITALAWLRQGEVASATAAFGTYGERDVYPFGRYFWADAGAIYAATARPEAAARVWSLARCWRPYAPYHVYKPYAVPLERLVDSSGYVPYYLGFDRFHQGGSRLAHAAALMAEMSRTVDPALRQQAALHALDQLEVCRSRGLYNGPAAVLTAQVYYLLQDYDSAILALERALAWYERVGDTARSEGIRADLAVVQRNKQVGLERLFSQSGVSRGRWEAEPDPAAKLAELRTAWADEPGVQSRRALARHLIRYGDRNEGRRLALGLTGQQRQSPELLATLPSADLELALEADRAGGRLDLAYYLVSELEAGRAGRWDSSELWVLVGFICLDAQQEAAARLALEHASALDPANQGLKRQLELMMETAQP